MPHCAPSRDILSWMNHVVPGATVCDVEFRRLEGQARGWPGSFVLRLLPRVSGLLAASAAGDQDRR